MRVIRGTPTAASCKATCRPMAPTPMTKAWQAANWSGGTRSRWRMSRSTGTEAISELIGPFLLEGRGIVMLLRQAPGTVLPPGLPVPRLALQGVGRQAGGDFQAL